MTIASEIERLQTAKTSLRTAIQNKGVSVPTSAKMDSYGTYVSQIQTMGVLSGVSLKNNRITGYDCDPKTNGLISWSNGNNLYGCCTVCTGNTSYNFYGLYTFKKTGSGDIVYQYTENGYNQDYRYTDDYLDSIVTLRNGNNIRVFGFTDWAYSGTSQSSWRTYCYQFDWNISTGSQTSTYLGQSTYRDYNYKNYGGSDTGYTEISGSTWVASAVGNNIDDSGYIYLTLK